MTTDTVECPRIHCDGVLTFEMVTYPDTWYGSVDTDVELAGQSCACALTREEIEAVSENTFMPPDDYPDLTYTDEKGYLLGNSCRCLCACPCRPTSVGTLRLTALAAVLVAVAGVALVVVLRR